MSFKVTNNKFVDNIILNMVGLIPLLVGIWLHNDGLILMSIIMYWVLVIAVILVALAPQKIWTGVVKKAFEPNEDMSIINNAQDKTYLKFNVIYDICLALLLATLGYGVLAAVYLIHIYGYLKTYSDIRKVADEYIKEAQEVAGQEHQESLDPKEDTEN